MVELNNEDETNNDSDENNREETNDNNGELEEHPYVDPELNQGTHVKINVQDHCLFFNKNLTKYKKIHFS